MLATGAVIGIIAVMVLFLMYPIIILGIILALMVVGWLVAVWFVFYRYFVADYNVKSIKESIKESSKNKNLA